MYMDWKYDDKREKEGDSEKAGRKLEERQELVQSAEVCSQSEPIPTTKASSPAEAKTSSSVILYNTGIHPKNVSGSSGRLDAAFFCRFLAAYKPVHRGRSA